MNIIVWLGRLVLFLAFFAFALFNTAPVTLNYVFGVWQAPLALVLLIFFAAGALFGIVVVLPTVFRQRSEARRLERLLNEAQRLSHATAATPTSDAAV